MRAREGAGERGPAGIFDADPLTGPDTRRAATRRTGRREPPQGIGALATRGSDGKLSRLQAAVDAEAIRALYIDFEGPKDKPPAFLGVHRSGDHVQPDIVDPSLASLGPSRTLRDAVAHVVVRAESKQRRIVSWSTHDLDVVRTLADEDPVLVERFERRYCNALRVAKRWRTVPTAATGQPRAAWRTTCRSLGTPFPMGGEGGDVGKIISDIRDRIERGLDPTPGQLTRWNRLVEHNWHDCVGMRRLCIHATRELEAVAAATV